jgi:hypothetical protein
MRGEGTGSRRRAIIVTIREVLRYVESRACSAKPGPVRLGAVYPDVGGVGPPCVPPL